MFIKYNTDHKKNINITIWLSKIVWTNQLFEEAKLMDPLKCYPPRRGGGRGGRRILHSPCLQIPLILHQRTMNSFKNPYHRPKTMTNQCLNLNPTCQ
uniref:Uncharacterized protein n=1 Tax=Rhizophora mucronata TaxID=61149 RepID=A0A2P2IK80_RHIMU